MKIVHAVILLPLVGASYFAVAADKPAYLQNRSDFVQQVYSAVIIGFAFETKCSFLLPDERSDYEKHVNFSTKIFQGYLLAKEFVLSPDDALGYIGDMVQGTKRFSKLSPCDTVAKKRVEEGFEVGKNYMSLIEVELKKESDQ